MKNFYVTEEASGPPKRTSGTSKFKQIKLLHVSFFASHFACLDPDPHYLSCGSGYHEKITPYFANKIKFTITEIRW
jgi:hypothetical protein